MKIAKLMLLFAALCLGVGAHAQNADEIIARHIDSVGGSEKLSQVKSVSTESTVQVMGSDNPSSSTLLNGVGFITQSDINGSKIVQCYTAKGGWSINPFAGGTDPEPMPADQYKTGKYAIYFGSPLYDYKAKGFKAELLGKEGNNYKIKMTAPDSTESTYFIDTATYQVTKATSSAVMQGQQVDVVSTFSNYKKIDFGIVVPYKVDMDFGQFQLSYVVNKVDINKEVDPKIFDMPAK